MPVLTAIDVLGVQRFIFSSNRLRDMVAGSYLVHRSTTREGALEDLVPREKILLAGGGNALVEFDSAEKAREFAARYTRRLYDNAYGLEAAIAHRSFEHGGLAQALLNIQIELARNKSERVPAAPLLGLSVTASCRETGLPATGFDPKEPTIPLSRQMSKDGRGGSQTFGQKEPPVPLSRDVLNRRGVKEEANAHWSKYLINMDGFDFPMEMDHLGRAGGDISQIGVVHVDGNGVGKKIASWLSRKIEDQADDDTVRREYQEWSLAIDKLGEKTFKAVIDRVVNCITDDNRPLGIKGKPEKLGFNLNKVKVKENEKEKWMLPLRPILLGGDDLTFVCDGRIALDLAETALGVFKNSDIAHLGKITACAGVAITRVHAPFARAYKLAEKLCRSAKVMLKENGIDDCALDWHIGLSRPEETVTSIRERQYQRNTNQLTCRPYRLSSENDDELNWRWLSETLLDDPVVGLRGKKWSTRRNKVKAFAELVREGPDGVKAALKAWNVTAKEWNVAAKELCLPEPIAENGFHEKHTPLLDALELLDLHLVLESDGQVGEEKP